MFVARAKCSSRAFSPYYEKGFASVTVSDITERAMVNRSTFYRHYLDKYDLLEHYLDDMSASVEDQQGRAGQLPLKRRQVSLIYSNTSSSLQASTV